MVDTENLDGELPISPESDESEGQRLQHIIHKANEKPAEETAHILQGWWDPMDLLAEYKAAKAKSEQVKEKCYESIDDLLLLASTAMSDYKLTRDERIKEAISKYEKACELASDLDDELRGKNKHLEVLNAYKKFLQNYELEWKDEKLKKVEALIVKHEKSKEQHYQLIDDALMHAIDDVINPKFTMTLFRKADKLASEADCELRGKNKHLEVLNAYKQFLQNCELEERDEELKRVEASISKLSQELNLNENIKTF